MSFPSHLLAADGAPAGAPGRISMTPDGRIHECDATAARLLRREREALEGRSFGQLVAPAYGTLFDGFLRDVVAGRRPVETALGLRAPDGAVVTVLLDAISAVAGPHIDVTLVALATAVGAQAETPAVGVSFRTVADALPAMVAYWSRGLRCGFANKAYREWFGRTPEQVVGLELRELLGEDLFRMNEPYLRAVLDGEPQGFERALTKANGEVGYTWTQYIPETVDGAVQGFFVLASDITDLKRAQQAAREHEARFRAVIDASPVAHVLIDGSESITYLNPAFRNTFGYAREDIPTLQRWWIAAVADPAERGRLLEIWQARMRDVQSGRRPFEPMELRVRCKDGAERIVMARTATLGVAGANGGLIVLRDVTDERRLEREVLDAATREQHRFGVELHEHLAQDLAAASMALDLLCARAEAEPGAVNATEMAELATRLRQCVENTRSMAHALSPVELGFGGLQGALERLAATVKRRRQLDVAVTLTGFEHGTLEPLVTEHVYRIAQEALANAARHSRGTAFAVDATIAADRLLLVVRDNGIGLGDPRAAHGPGFSIMRYRARALGGQLAVDAAPGGGTIVRLICPLRRQGTVLQARDVPLHDRIAVTWH